MMLLHCGSCGKPCVMFHGRTACCLGFSKFWYEPMKVRRAMTEKLLPEWQCHKTVQAAKIVKLDNLLLINGNAHPYGRVHFVDAATLKEGEEADPKPIDLTFGEFMRVANGCAQYGELGYLVIYKDGYKSWSPTQAFEDGYVPL